MNKKTFILPAILLAFTACNQKNASTAETPQTDTVKNQEPHLQNIRQLTYGGDNAEAYFSFNNQMLTYQKYQPSKGILCDQMYLIDLNATNDTNTEHTLLSTGKGRTTCSYFMPGDSTILYASTHLASADCPPEPEPDKQHRYLWAIYPSFDIFIADLKGNIKKQLTNHEGYDAEATVSPDGKMIVFTSTRDGDLDLYTMDIDGKNIKRVTHELGYDGGAFFSPDSKKLVFRASRPQTDEEKTEYKELLKNNLVAPTNMEIYTCNVDGSDLKQITKLGKANWAPFYHPSGEKIIFSSNHHSTGRGYNFQLFMINADGTGEVEQITNKSIFNAFPMFSPDGKKLIFSSNRNSDSTKHRENTDLFIANWQE